MPGFDDLDPNIAIGAEPADQLRLVGSTESGNEQLRDLGRLVGSGSTREVRADDHHASEDCTSKGRQSPL